jgi:hypothetical protein
MPDAGDADAERLKRNFLCPRRVRDNERGRAARSHLSRADVRRDLLSA